MPVVFVMRYLGQGLQIVTHPKGSDNHTVSFLPVVFIQQRYGEIPCTGIHIVSHEARGLTITKRLPHLAHYRVPNQPVHPVIKVSG
jgi:hypothetical protein